MTRREKLIREPIDRHALWRWTAPWILGAVLAIVALLGLSTASHARDADAYAVGFATAGLALLALVWLVKRACDGQAVPPALPLLVQDAATLVVLAALLAAQAVLGLLLAARAGDITLRVAGYGLFGFSLVFLFWNVKHYFDIREHSPPR